MNSIISNYLDERKEEWLKKKIKANMNDAEKTALLQEAQEKYSLAKWLPDAAKRACQLSMATHPSKFSHPSAKTSSIIATANRANDGYLRTGNATYDIDVFGNAAAMDVYKFLSLKLEDNQTILYHLETDSSEIKSLFAMPPTEFDAVKRDFLAIKQNDSSQITDGLVKQVYFPVGKDYHLLSILPPSGLLSRLKKQIDTMRFSDTAKEARECRKANKYHAEGYDELYGLTVTAYGGTKPQNISVLNSQNGGVSYLLQSSPPILIKRDLRLPKQDFFDNTLRISLFKESFESLHRLMKGDYRKKDRKEGIKESIENALKYIIDQALAYVFPIRAFGKGWSNAPYYNKLPKAQRIWLDDAYLTDREDEEKWLKPVSETFARWVIRSYEKILKQDGIMLGDTEHKNIFNLVNETISNDKESFK